MAALAVPVSSPLASAGHHRSLGTHITRVRSVTMDNWDPASVQLMASVGNVKGNQYWEARLPAHQRLNPSVDDRVRADFIRAKYVARAFYGAPVGSDEAADTPTTTEAKPMSKMEQRQARLQARAGAAQPAVAAQVAAPVPTPTVNIRQSSVPITSSSRPATTVSSDNAGLFAGMNGASTATVAHAAAAAPIAAPVVKTPAKMHSSSPWVTRSDVLQSAPAAAPVVAQVPASHHAHGSSQPAASVSSSVVNLLDFSASSQPAVHPAPGHAVDDMFAGLSVAEPSAMQARAPTVETGSTNELMDFYSHEPASAPARSQHTAPQSLHQQQHHQPSSFGFISDSPPLASSPSNGGGAFPDLYEAPSATTSSFSFLADSAPTGQAAAPAADSAFSFLGGDASDASLPSLGSVGADVPDMSTLIVLPGQYGLPPTTMMPMGIQQQQPIPGFLAPMAAPMTHSYSQPLQGTAHAGDLFGAGGGFAMQQPLQPQATGVFQPAYGQQQMPNNPYGQAQPLNGMQANGLLYSSSPYQQAPLMGGGGSLLAPLPPFAGAMNNAPGVPQFSVVSVQATQRAQQQAAQDIQNDPFAGISTVHSSPSLSQSPPLGGSPPAPKAPHQCEVDGCDGKKIARGLCSKHIRGDGAAPTPTQVTGGATTSAAANFDFLATTNASQLQQQQQDTSSFAFLSETAPAQQQQSSFGFM